MEKIIRNLTDATLDKELAFAVGFNFPSDDGPSKDWLNALQAEKDRRSLTSQMNGGTLFS